MAIDNGKVLYIAGDGRSGTTLLDQMLGQDPGFFSTGELCLIWKQAFLENLLCGCGNSFRQCEFWTEVVRVGFGGWQGIDARETLSLWVSVSRLRHFPAMWSPLLKYNSQYQAQVMQLNEIWVQLYRAIAQISGARVIVDSSKAPMGAIALAQSHAIDLRVIHLIRDSRAVAYSARRRKVRPEIVTSEAFLPMRSPAKVAIHWNLTNIVAEDLRCYTGNKYMQMRYEDLVTAPRRMISQIANLAGESYDARPFIGEQAVDLGTTHTVAGNPSRFKRGFVEIRPDEEWRIKMSRSAKWLVTALTMPLLWKYKYLPRS